MTETLHGQPIPPPPMPGELRSEIPPPAGLPGELAGAGSAEEVIRAAIGKAFAPVIDTWSQRSQDMLDVLADSGQARTEVRRAVATIRLAAMLGVLALVAFGLGIWLSLEKDRSDRRRVRQLDEQGRNAESAELSRRLANVCARHDERVEPAPGRSDGQPGPGAAP